MRRIQTEQIKGNEVVARDVYSTNGAIIVAEGTKLKLEYKHKLLELKIYDIFIEDEISKEISGEEYTDEIVKDLCSTNLNNTIESFAYSPTEDTTRVCEIAEGIMENVLSKKEVLYNVSMVRRFDRNISEHCLSVAALSVLTALNSGFSTESTREIAIGALLHDIGYLSMKVDYQKLGVAELTEDEKKEIRRHVVYGYMLVEKQKWLSPIAKDIILYHHERIDGSGYPFRLSGERIKPEVRLVSICDAFDNMIYGTLEPRKKVYEAMEYIMGNAGTKFDREYAMNFNNSVAAFPVGTLVKTNTEEVGIVIRQNNQAPTRPVLRKLKKDENGEWKATDIEYDLIKDLTIFIVDTQE
ncbi:MAG: HD domain-containing protein [Lachnospiraceae bacterium]|nr:HD domain-containing protein [Lachnospiraceae bacterium]